MKHGSFNSSHLSPLLPAAHTQDDKQLVVNRLSELVEQKFPIYAPHTLASPILFGDFKWVLGTINAIILEPSAAHSILRVVTR